MAKQLKVTNGNVKYLLKTFDGSYVLGEMPEGAIDTDKLAEDSEIKGFELTDGDYLFETTESKSKRTIEDEV